MRDAECFGDVVCTEEFLAVRALEHFVGEASDVSGCDIDWFNADGRAFDFVVAFLDYVEVSPDIFDAAFEHCTERAVVDESGNGTVYFGRRPDESSSSGEFHDFFVSIFVFGHVCLVMGFVK